MFLSVACHVTERNAPMEYFWDCEWLYDKHFKTPNEASGAVFEYVEIFYIGKGYIIETII